MSHNASNVADVYITQWCDENRPFLWRYIFYKVSDHRDSVDDIVQEVFERAQRSLRNKDPETIVYPKQWLKKIADCVCSEYIRRIQVERAYCQPLLSSDSGDERNESGYRYTTTEKLSIVSRTLEADVLHGALHGFLAQEVRALPQNEQNVIIAHYIDGKKLPQIAEEARRSRSAIYQDHRRGLHMLRTRLEEWNG